MKTERHQVRVTFNDGDRVVTTINGTVQSIRDYYLNNEFVASDEKTMRKVERIEFYRVEGQQYRFKGEAEGIHESSGFADFDEELTVNPKDYIGKSCTVIEICNDHDDNLTYIVEFEDGVQAVQDTDNLEEIG